MQGLPEYDPYERGRWNRKDFEGYFITLAVGENPHQRVNRQNPPIRMEGLVIDIDDSLSNMDEFLEFIHKQIPRGIRPNWVARTHSGMGYRLFYEFSRHETIHTADYWARLASALVDELKVRTLPGKLDTCYREANHFYEIGRDWTQVQKEALPGVVFTSAREKMITKLRRSREAFGSAPKVSWPALMAHCKKQWPHAADWDNLQPGGRTIRAWDPAADNATSAHWFEDGVYCHSTGEHYTFSHPMFLGPDGVEACVEDRIRGALENIHYDGKVYWKLVQGNRWVDISRGEIKDVLEERGLSRRKVDEWTASELTQALNHLNEERLAGVASLFYRPPGVVEIKGQQFLNVSSLLPAVAVGGPSPEWGEGFPTIAEWLDNVMPEDCRVHHLMVLKHWWEGAVSLNPTQGLVTIVIGEPSIGKNWWFHGVLAVIAGRKPSDPEKWLKGEEIYNAEHGESPIWYLSDVEISSPWEARRFGGNLKKVVADGKMIVREMYRAPVPVEWKGRIFLAYNTDLDSLQALPDSGALFDKAAIYTLNDYKMDYYPSDEEIAEEVPAFLNWLSQMEIPEEWKDQRFGVKAYESEGAITLVPKNTYHEDRIELATKVVYRYLTENESSDMNRFRPSDVYDYMADPNVPAMSAAKSAFRDPSVLGRAMARLEHLTRKRSNGFTFYCTTQEGIDKMKEAL
jgi:hypothetical protein